MSALNDISQFFPIQISILKEGRVIPFTVHVHLQLNRRIVPLRSQDDEVDPGFIVKYRDRGVEQLFVLNAHRRFYEEYLKGVLEEESGPAVDAAVKTLEEKKDALAVPLPPKPGDPNTPPMVDPFTKNPNADASAEVQLTAEQKQAIQEALKGLDNENPEAQEAAVISAQNVVEAIVAADEDKTSLFTDVWQEAKSETLDGHAINISTYAVIFSLGMGFKDRVFLKNISLAALIHDLGVTQFDFETVRTPQENRSTDQRLMFEEHVRYTLEIIASLDVKFSADVIRLVGGHHEKFDGTGYPRHLKNWDVDTIAQVLSMADIFDAMIRGRYDGQNRTLTEAFSFIVKLEKSKIFPQYYNPDLFKKLVQWVEQETNKNILEQADTIVAETVKENIKDKAA